jgi:hypothetical protein
MAGVAANQAENWYHEARLLLVIDGFTTRRGGIAGLTKLAKLDFLLRYPVMLERLISEGFPDEGWSAEISPSEAERLAVESRMIRYKYGPWDDRYYGMIASLAARGLVEVSDGRTRVLRATDAGRSAAQQLAQEEPWRLIAQRVRFLRRNFNLSGSRLKNAIYSNLPDVVDRPHRREI